MTNNVPRFVDIAHQQGHANPLHIRLEKSLTEPVYNTILFQTGDHRDDLQVTLKRTVRVADNGDRNNLPPGLGSFPLYPASAFDAIPPTAGLFFPMYQREAMWMNFTSTSPFAVKIYVGGVNAISGQPRKEGGATLLHLMQKMKVGRPLQDYVVTPKQRWLDGIADSNGLVRQFVAMPHGSGYSVEHQICGQDFEGGIQIEVTPAVLTPSGYPNTPMSILVRDPDGNRTKINTHKAEYVDDVKTKVMSQIGVPAAMQSLTLGGRTLEDNRRLGFYGIQAGNTINLVIQPAATPKKSLNAPNMAQGRSSMGKTNKGDVEMVATAGGLIRQSIIRDDSTPDEWDAPRTTKLDIRILNTEAFSAITGMPAPSTPVTARQYAAIGYPYFEIFNEQPSGIHGNFSAVRSVNQLDKTKPLTPQQQSFIAEVDQSTKNPITSLDYKGRFRHRAELETQVANVMNLVIRKKPGVI